MIVDNGDGTCSIQMPPPWHTPKPLTDKEIIDILTSIDLDGNVGLRFARAIEERHGIK